jgi:hypothetical protein
MVGLATVIVLIVFLFGYRAALSGASQRRPAKFGLSRVLSLGLLAASVGTVVWWFAVR